VDVLAASCHWGLGKDVLQYMKEIAHAAIDAGADIVVGHGPHYSLPVEVYRGRPIFYGLGSFSFHSGHGGRRHDNWVGMMARITARKGGVEAAAFQFVRPNDRNETYLCRLADEADALGEVSKASALLGTKLVLEGDQVRVAGLTTSPHP